ncbi:uncharacterized protein LOC122048955 isoform X2 [Zingiber officinale]|uniref:uncharacterized protein LOC122048955 isoform X2 n=1 Tax=Zingiber officinale TaxID=94328 RepID=UPI001C4BC5C9|nr:uncharacterized protein LOC122048955 isoform X2 [Zingiber officinale]
MVLGLRSKQKKCAVHVEYIIHIHEIKPWPPSQSLKSLHSVVLHWENGDHQSGSTCIVIPDLGSGAAEGKLEFNESFKLQVTLLKEGSSKGNEKGTFQKNALEFNLYEPKRDKFKGQHLGSAVINLAEYGIVKEAVTANIPVTSKRSFRNIMQPVLYVKIQPMDDADMGSISGESLSKEVPVDKDVKESVSKLMNEENVEENEITSFTDDGISSLSALDHSSAQEVKADTLLHNDAEENKNVPEIMNPNGVVGDSESKLCLPSVPTKLGSELKESHLKDAALHQNNALPESVSVGSLSITKGQENMNETHGESETSLLLIMESNIISTVSSSTQKIPEEVIGSSSTKDATNRNSLSQEVEEISIGCSSRENVVEVQVHVEDNGLMTEIVESSDFTLQAEVSNISESEPNIKQNGKTEESINDSEESINEHVADNIFKEKQMGLIFGAEVDEDHLTISQTMNGALESPVGTTAILEHISIIQQRETKQSKGTLSTDATLSSWRSLHERHNSSFSTERLRTMKLSVRSPPHSMGSITYGANEQDKEYVKEVDIQEDASNTSTNSGTDDGRDDNGSTSSGSSKAKQFPRRNGRILSNDKVHELELRVKSLEAELREAAAIEIALYSSLAEHGISAHKVHTPARRLSRMYRHASRQWPTERMTSAARSIASGLALVAKACGHDVARLTFWLSNTIVLRAIVTETIKYPGAKQSASTQLRYNGSVKLPGSKHSPLKWESVSHKNKEFSFSESFGDWDDPATFISALEKIESWIFSRTIEYVWWQIFTPCMQSGRVGGAQQLGSFSSKSFGKQPSMVYPQQTNLSLEIWKKAFIDTSKLLCPLRSEGLECGCLPMLSRMVMEQCVARLDVAMFNAILRESDDEIPTDPMSDPIGDSKVLPIPTGSLSFGSGAQLKNAVGNWSRWLTDLFGMDVDESHADGNSQDEKISVAKSFKSFYSLNALSDLLMLPKDMLLEKSIRKEACSTFSPNVINHILNRFLPDEFCPDPVPNDVLQALESEEYAESSQEEIRSIPNNASPIIYSPPSTTSIESFIGEIRINSLTRIGSSVIRKCHQSDDELDEFDSPLSSIINGKSPSPKSGNKENDKFSSIRYQLLREVWRIDE